MPSTFRDLRCLDQFRLTAGRWASDRADWPVCGAFDMPSPVMGRLHIIASGDAGWDHVSVSLANRCPVWAEMEHVKRAFWRDDAVAMQLHVPPAAHISVHPYCLHLWACWAQPIPLPPHWMVG